MVTYVLLVVNIAVFAVCAMQARAVDLSVFMPPLFDRWVLSIGDVAAGDYWRLLTAGFLHLDLFHLGVNMVSLYLLGRSLEPALGAAEYTMVYVTALFGGSATVIMLGDPRVLTAGASGAIYGLMGALLVVVLNARVSPAPVVGIIVVNVVLSVTLPGISILAHLGGLAFGALSATVFVFVPRLLTTDPERHTPAGIRRAIRGTWTIAALLLIVAVVLGVVGVELPRVDLP